MQLLEENTEINPYDLRFGNRFLKQLFRIKSTNNKILKNGKFDFKKLKTFVYQKIITRK